MHNFFQHCQSTETSEQATEGELVKYLKVTMPVEHSAPCCMSQRRFKGVGLFAKFA